MQSTKLSTGFQEQRKNEGGLRTSGMIKKSQPGKPLISVVTVVYNRASEIETTILSVLGQAYGNVEYIIVDGGSTDGTLEVIKQYENKIDYWISEPDKGIYDAMNKAIELATGDWINFMNSGDRLASSKVLDVFANKVFEGDVLFGDATVEYPTFQTNFRVYPIQQVWKHSPFCHQASFARASLMKQLKFDLQYKIGADHDFFYKAYKSGKKFEYINQVICFFDAKAGATKKFAVKAIKDKMNIALKYNFSIWKWVYFQGIILYVYCAFAAKRILGNHLTNYVLNILKAQKQKSI